MGNLKDKLTILVCTCDAYEDLWNPFFTLLRTYWPDLDSKIIMNTETKSFSFDGLDITTYSFGKFEYGQRMLKHLDKIETPFFILLLDDFFLRSLVSTSMVEKMIGFLETNKEVACMYCDENKYVNNEQPFPPFYRMNRYAPYKLNMQAAIWRTDSFKKYWRPYDNPWRWEAFVNITTFDKKDIFYCLKERKNSPIDYGFNPDGMGVYRGKWVLEDVKPLFVKHNINIDFTKRGTYNKETASSPLPISKTVGYIFRRLSFRRAFMFYVFAIKRRICRYFGKDEKRYVYYLADKEFNKNYNSYQYRSEV